jgi:transposase
MHATHIGIDLAKSVFEVAVSRVPGKVDERHRLSRARLIRYLGQSDPAEVLLEACASAHHWGRELQRIGHHVTLLHPADVARYRDGNKTDRADATALLEASRNHSLDPVPIKSVEQQAIGALHRIRQGYLRTRTARINAVRGHLMEFGITIPVGWRHVLPHAREALETELVPPYLRRAIEDSLEEIQALKAKADGLRDELEHFARQMPDALLLMSVPGVGVLTATALLAFVGHIRRFRSGRDFAAYFGLTPREHSSGSTRRLGSITKRGNAYLRTMLIHGARAALRAGKLTDQPDDLRAWAITIERRSGHNVAAVALANKLARVCWRVWRDQRPFEKRSTD